MATLTFKNLNKYYQKKFHAVIDFNLEIKDKEFIVFVGPSGCGKSTTLRMVAGLEEISSGELYIDDKLVNDIAPKDRDIAMVFQNYALYPHMSVYNNLAFGLKLHKKAVPALDKNGNKQYIPDQEEINRIINEICDIQESQGVEADISELEAKIQYLKDHPTVLKLKYVNYSREEISERVHRAAKILGLEEYLSRKPSALSGGQRQRVALGRAIVRSPKVFLMDEPLSNLDAKLRVSMRSEIIKIHKEVGATTIYVTHDQTEAMTMADRIVIMKDGVTQQVGTPEEVYNNPANIFVAGFIGAPSMNFFNGKIKDQKFIFDNDNNEISLTKDQLKLLKDYEGKEIVLGVRPEDIYTSENKENSICFKVDLTELLGNELLTYGQLGEQRIIMKVRADAGIKENSLVHIVFDDKKVHFFDKESTNRII